jgi:hypothetical protein
VARRALVRGGLAAFAALAVTASLGPLSAPAAADTTASVPAEKVAVVGAGDITGDGKADLVARDTSGNLYRYTGNGKGSFGGRKKIATGWKGYKSLF